MIAILEKEEESVVSQLKKSVSIRSQPQLQVIATSKKRSLPLLRKRISCLPAQKVLRAFEDGDDQAINDFLTTQPLDHVMGQAIEAVTICARKGHLVYLDVMLGKLKDLSENLWIKAVQIAIVESSREFHGFMLSKLLGIDDPRLLPAKREAFFELARGTQLRQAQNLLRSQAEELEKQRQIVKANDKRTQIDMEETKLAKEEEKALEEQEKLYRESQEEVDRVGNAYKMLLDCPSRLLPKAVHEALRTALHSENLLVIECLLNHHLSHIHLNQSLVLATRCRNMPAISLLLRHGANDVNEALSEASRVGLLDAVKLFQSKGANDINKALLASCVANRADVTTALLQSGALACYQTIVEQERLHGQAMRDLIKLQELKRQRKMEVSLQLQEHKRQADEMLRNDILVAKEKQAQRDAWMEGIRKRNYQRKATQLKSQASLHEYLGD